MQISELSNDELLARIKEAALNERKLTVQVLLFLGEVESRGLFRDLGYPSLFEYCRQVLRYSDGSAYRRVAAARCLRDDPLLQTVLSQES